MEEKKVKRQKLGDKSRGRGVGRIRGGLCEKKGGLT